MAAIVDFHGHWFPPAVAEARASASLPAVVRDAWPLLTDVGAQLEAAQRAAAPAPHSSPANTLKLVSRSVPGVRPLPQPSSRR